MRPRRIHAHILNAVGTVEFTIPAPPMRRLPVNVSCFRFLASIASQRWRNNQAPAGRTSKIGRWRRLQYKSEVLIADIGAGGRIATLHLGWRSPCRAGSSKAPAPLPANMADP